MTSSELKSSASTSDSKLNYYKDRLKSQAAGAHASASDAQAAAENNGVPPQDLSTQLEAAQQEIAKLKNEMQELQTKTEKERLLGLADLENTRRRLQKDREDILKYGNESLLRELLTTLDNLERTTSHLNPAQVDRSIAEGIELVFKQLLATLQRVGVQIIETEGKAFDPHLHEAIGQKNLPGVEPNQVVETLQKGYRYHDRLLRPARVTVSI